MSFVDSRAQHIADLERAAQGEVDVHVWKSFNYGVFMKTVTVEPAGAPIPEELVYDPGTDITKEYEIYYAGVMSPEEAAHQAAEMNFVDLTERELL